LDGASWVGSIVLLDYVAAVLAFAAAGGYLVLKALNDRHSALMRVIEQMAVLFYSLGIHELPGLPDDYRTLRQFGIPSLADPYLITMAGLHVLATAGLLALAHGLSVVRPWARRAHIGIAGLILLILGAYAYVYAKSSAPRIGLVVIACGAAVPSAVLAILLIPRIASLFSEAPRPISRTATTPGVRDPSQPRVALGLVLALYMLGALATVAVMSVPVAITLRVALAPAP
jgi:hypothetical protein